MLAKLIALVVPLGLDTFAVCCALGTAGVPTARRYRISALMVTFEAGMPLVGLAIGLPLGHVMGDAADYLAIGILAVFGLYMLVVEDDEKRSIALLDATDWRAVALGVSISLDELGVGFTLGLLRLPVAIVIIAIAVQTLVVTQLGMRLGARLGERVRERTEQLAGIALLALACVLLLEQLAG